MSDAVEPMTQIACREGCAACCIAPSISSPIPGMPHGKPAGVACVQLTADLRCALFGMPERPAVCASLRPTAGMCGTTRAEALAHLETLERLTRPDRESWESARTAETAMKIRPRPPAETNEYSRRTEE